MPYFPASSSGPGPGQTGPNGSLPIPAGLVALMQAQLAKVNSGENAARQAVLGYCTNPANYAALPNIAAEITAAPTIAQTIQNLTSASSFSPVSQPTSGTAAAAAAAPVTAGTASAVAAAGSGGTVGSPSGNPVCWTDKAVATVPLQGTTPLMPGQGVSLSLRDSSNAGLGAYPLWGDSFGAGSSPASAVSSVTGWFAANPGVVAALFLGAVALLFGRE